MTPQQLAQKRFREKHVKVQVYLDRKEVEMLDSIAAMKQCTRAELIRMVLGFYKEHLLAVGGAGEGR